MLEELRLTTAVQLVRDELLQAAAASSDEDLRFEVGPVGMEFTVELRKDVQAKAGFRVWVVSAGVDGKAGTTNTHKVSLTLTPKWTDGSPVLVSRDEQGTEDDDGPLFSPPDRS